MHQISAATYLAARGILEAETDDSTVMQLKNSNHSLASCAVADLAASSFGG